MGLLAPCWVANATCNDFGVCVLTSGGQKWEVLGGNLPSINVSRFREKREVRACQR